MCKFAKLASQIGLICILLSIIVMITGWVLFEVNVCVVAIGLMCLAAISFILCMICNCVHSKPENPVS